MRISPCLSVVALLACGSNDPDVATGGKAGQNDAMGGKGGGSSAIAGHSGAAGKTASDGGQSGTHAGGGDRSAAGSGESGARIELPRLYPIVRAGTPRALIADPAFLDANDPSLEVIPADDAGTSPPTANDNQLARAVQERLYTPGPTSLLRIVHALDERIAGLDTTPSQHACLLTKPLSRILQFPGGQNFVVQLQCMQRYPGGWVAFGFEDAQADADAGAGGRDFYLIEGQDGGMGGAFHVRAGGGHLEGWLSVADSRAPNNSQVIMHLLVDNSPHTTELAFAGSGVGFCSAHLKVDGAALFIRAKTNAPPPPGSPNGHYCNDLRVGCFATAELDRDLGANATLCAPVAPATFGIRTNLDATLTQEANVVPARIYELFNTPVNDIAAF
jgi:hypothetical protein